MTETHQFNERAAWLTIFLTMLSALALVAALAMAGCAQLQPFVDVAGGYAGDIGVQRTEEAVQACQERDEPPVTEEDRADCLREELGKLAGIVDVCQAGQVAAAYIGGGDGGDVRAKGARP